MSSASSVAGCENCGWNIRVLWQMGRYRSFLGCAWSVTRFKAWSSQDWLRAFRQTGLLWVFWRALPGQVRSNKNVGLTEPRTVLHCQNSFLTSGLHCMLGRACILFCSVVRFCELEPSQRDRLLSRFSASVFASKTVQRSRLGPWPEAATLCMCVRASLQGFGEYLAFAVSQSAERVVRFETRGES